MNNVIFKKELKRYFSTKHKEVSLITQKPKPEDFEYKDFNKHPIFVAENTSHDEKTFVETFANPLYSVLREYYTVVVEEDGDKVALKFFFGYKSRKEGKSWFKVVKNVDYISVNRKTGDVYAGFLHNYQKKKKFTRSIRRNYFLNKPLSTLISKIKNTTNALAMNGSDVATHAAEVFLDALSCPPNSLSSDIKLFRFYMDKKNLKYPNNFWVYDEVFIYPNFRKRLKKNDNNIVKTFMDVLNLKGKKLKKFLHECNKLNIKNYQSSREFFGDDWLNQDGNFIKDILESDYNFSFPTELKSLLTFEELKKVYSTYKNSILNKVVDQWTLSDHMRMYLQLKKYGETEIKWMTDGTDFRKFSEEHLDFTEKLQHYKKGTYTRIYPDFFQQNIEKEIDGYFPVILKTSKDYNGESLIQSNCVKTYIGRASSFIISLRKGNIDSEQRATIEYRIHKLTNTNILNAQRVQTLGRFNGGLDETWNEVLLKLDEIVVSSFLDKRFEKMKLTKVCQNGVIFSTESIVDSQGNLDWEINENLNVNYFEW